MDIPYYLNKFQNSINQFDIRLFNEKQLILNVGVYLNCAVLKVQKKAWLNDAITARPFKESVFFSIWVSEQSLNAGRLYYNIHALKMRELKGYNLKSRDFAAAFRTMFRVFAHDWPNVSVNYGPLTLMEGWVAFDETNFDTIVKELAYKFLAIEFIIDELLAERKK